MNDKFDLTISATDVSEAGFSGLQPLQARFGRITVILGANGSGKSKLLFYLKMRRSNAFGGPRRLVWVEGGRAINLPSEIRLQNDQLEYVTNFARARDRHTDLYMATLGGRITHAFVVLERLAQEEKVQHSNAVAEWMRSGQQGQCPERPESALNRLFRMFNEVFPSITLTFEPPQLRAHKGAATYPIAGLSDGEKQALALLADVCLLAERNSLILVDEPELNMHANLALHLWSTIETELPDCVFVYATHSISFAMRSSVDEALVLTSKGNVMQLSDPAMSDSGELRPFLGAVPAILRADRTIVVEGDDFSLDADLYHWILDNRSLEIVALGGCDQVISASLRRGLWSSVAKEFKMVGIIDRDYRTEKRLTQIAAETNCHVLAFHEIESYLCEPKLLAAVAGILKIADPIPTVDDISLAILSFAKENVTRTAAYRTFERAQVNLAISLSKRVLAETKESDLETVLRREAQAEADKASPRVGPDEVSKIFQEEIVTCKKALGDVHEILKIFPGKELVNRLAHMVGCANVKQLALAAKNHLNPTDFKHTEGLRAALLNELQ